jgi:hypothetical protein
LHKDFTGQMIYSPGASMGSSQALHQPNSDFYQFSDSPARPLPPTALNLSPFTTQQLQFTETIRSSQPLNPNATNFGMNSDWEYHSGHNAGAYGTVVGSGNAFDPRYAPGSGNVFGPRNTYSSRTASAYGNAFGAGNAYGPGNISSSWNRSDYGFGNTFGPGNAYDSRTAFGSGNVFGPGNASRYVSGNAFGTGQPIGMGSVNGLITNKFAPLNSNI